MMLRVLSLLIFFISSQVDASEFLIKNGNSFQIKYKDHHPIQLVYADQEQVIFTKGSRNLLTKEIEFLNKQLRSIKKIALKTSRNDRVDHLVWTGKQLILLWEKQAKNDRALYYQVIAPNGRKINRVYLGNLENSFSHQLRHHQVETIQSPNSEYFGFIIRDVTAKSYQGKDAKFLEFIAVFDQSGKLLEKQKNHYNSYFQQDGVYFLTDAAEIVKFRSNTNKNEILVDSKNFLDKTKEHFKIDLNFPDTANAISYQIIYNQQHNTYDYISTTKSHDTIIGQNGIYVSKLDLAKKVESSNWYLPYSEGFVEGFKNNPKAIEGNILMDDLSLSNDFVFRKTLPNSDGSFYIVSEHYSSYIPPYLREELKHEYTAAIQNRLNVSNQLNTSYTTMDFIVTYVNANGQIDWIKRFPKLQEGLGFQYGSFDAYTDQGDLYLFYNREKPVQSFIKTLDKNRVIVQNIVPICRKITPTGEHSFFNLSKELQNNMIFYPLFSNGIKANVNQLMTTLIQEKTNKSPCDAMIIQIRKQKATPK